MPMKGGLGEGRIALPPNAFWMDDRKLTGEPWHRRMTPVTRRLAPRSFLARTFQVRAADDRGAMLGHGRPRRHHTSRSTI
jgi:hypothetical protein